MSHSHFAANDGQGEMEDDDDERMESNVPVAIIWPVVLSRTIGNMMGMRDLKVYHDGYSNLCVIAICDDCFKCWK